MLENPLAREVLDTKYGANIQVPIGVINQVSAYQNNMQISDLNFEVADTILAKNQNQFDNAQENLIAQERIIYDEDDTVMAKEPTYSGEGEISEEIIEPHGIDLPTIIYKDANEAIDLSKHKPEIRKFIKNIFLDKHPEAVALHAMDSGNFSLTLGYTKLRLREGETLPRSKRIFHISPSDQRHLDDICDFLIHYGYIRRAPVHPNNCHLYGLSAYLVPRAKPGKLGRLIVDFSPINPLIETPSSVIPEISATLQMLQGKAMFTSLDLRYAFMGLRMDEQSSALTTFLTPSGSYQWISLPTGAANSPAYFTDSMNKILHYSPVRDERGDLLWDEPNVVKQKYDPLTFVTNYMDDIMVTSELKSTYEDTLEAHFRNVEQAVDRLAFHGAKCNVMKCEFSRSKILFLGWYITRDFIIADPRRVEKVRDFKFPDSKKSMRAFLGLVNSMRRVINMEVIKQVNVLTPLTSSKNDFKTNDSHLEAFNQIKQMLISQPLFCNLIDEKAEKFLFCDASTSNNVLGAVLLQKIKGENHKIVPYSLDLENEIHRLIFDKELPYEPARLYTSLPIVLPKPAVLRTRPPDILPEEKLLGFTEDTVKDSFFWSTISILALYNCVLLKTLQEYKVLAMKTLRKNTLLNNKIKDFTFNMNYNEYKNFVDDFYNGKVGMDPNYYLAEALAYGLYRKVIIISSLDRHKEKPILTFNPQSEKPPLIYGVYLRQNYEIFTPFFLNKNQEFQLASLSNKVQVIAYVSKTVPETFKSRAILDLEVFGLLTSLYSLQRFISGVNVTLLTDSRVLYYLFSRGVHNSSVKIKRWCLKILSDYPNINLHFIRTTENLADFLTKEGLPEGDLERFNLKDLTVRDFYNELPKLDFTLTEWVQFVSRNPDYLSVNNKAHLPTKAVTLSISKGLENVTAVTTPIDTLKNRLSREEIIKNQKHDFQQIYQECLKNKNFTYIKENRKKGDPFSYKLENGLLLAAETREKYKILVPKNMIGPLLAYIHLVGHRGLSRMLMELEPYYFKNKYTVTREFTRCCYSCFLTSTSNKHVLRGIYPTPTRAFEEISLDLAENIGNTRGYQHLLVVICNFSDFLLIFPLKSKTNTEIARVMRDGVLMQYNVRKIRSDNGPGFRGTAWLEIMAAMGVEIINSSALNPSANGGVERAIQTVKLLYKKLLATKSNYNWDYLNFLVAKIHNTTVSPRNGCKPAELVYGNGPQSDSFLSLDKIVPPHHSVANNKVEIEKLSKEIKEFSDKTRDRLTKIRQMTADKLNKHRIDKNLKVTVKSGNIVRFFAYFIFFLGKECDMAYIL
jgi:hypothetical protein